MTGPLVSVGIPAYNRLDGLRRTLECFTGQTYENLEIIVSDNCSPDDPTAMIQAYVKKDKRIKYYRQEKNVGMTLNGHFVWGKATGKYFILGSDDDWWGADFVSDLVVLLLKEEDAVCAFCDFEEVDENGRKIVSLSRYAKARKLLGVKTHSYPDHYPLLKELCDKNVVNKLKNFILQEEYDGKANIHRSICDRQVFLDSIAKLYDLGLAECWAFDQLLAFAILTRGHLALSDKILFKCTAGNQKHYVDPRSRIVYLEGYVKIIDDCMGAQDAKELKRAVNSRYLDKTVGFYQEYLQILKDFIRKAAYINNEASLKCLKDVGDLVKAEEHHKAALLAKEFSADVDMPKQNILNKVFDKLLPFGDSRLTSNISAEILRKVESYK